ncbi:UDP-4-amino-4,6-dideoxy-N-acetyl-beta-L-altrosamine N-acetyltransferase [Nonlabens ulvanivorans]|uniref:Flagellin modification protein FlmH n=1 Tax=Nonlabens ulvanivorans TaxID=906888 RepID=A0A090Q9N5_NONUL|nr:UDP-4-amino-4,6-dideoxy-N-acetyl-beta-L-altrosamine N-acetyltransferase [Nonlabens ulvanivorans]GAK99705.1 flagellin modification protein FlmH [Nonlabens ulvanivorans]
MKDIKLIPLTEDKLELVRTWRNSTEVSSYMYTESIITAEQQSKWFDSVRDDKSSQYWIIEFDGKDLGLASLTNIDNNLSSCYWAFYLGDTSVRGAGIGAKVEFKVLSHVFDELNLNKLRCEVFEFNNNVIKMHEKFGFRREAFYREHCFKNKDWQNVIGLAMLKKEWETTKELLKTRIYG